MTTISRRKFVLSGTITGLGAYTGISVFDNRIVYGAAIKSRNSPLDGITKEKISITDMKVTLLSCPLPPE